VPKKRTTKRKVALATTRKKAQLQASSPAATAPVPAPDPDTRSAGITATDPGSPAPAESPADAEVWREVQQHITDIERNLGELRESMRAHDLLEAIEPVLMDIKTDVEAGRLKSELTAAGMDQVREDLAELHSQLVAVSRIGLRTEAQVDDIVGRMEAPEPPPAPPPPPPMPMPMEYSQIPPVPMWERPPAVLGACAVVLVAALLLFLQTGNLKLALGLVVAANLLGCTLVLVARKL